MKKREKHDSLPKYYTSLRTAIGGLTVEFA